MPRTKQAGRRAGGAKRAPPPPPRPANDDPPANRRGVFIDPEELANVQLVQVFLAYSYLLYVGCNMISDGAELLMLTPFRPGR